MPTLPVATGAAPDNAVLLLPGLRRRRQRRPTDPQVLAAMRALARLIAREDDARDLAEQDAHQREQA
jgi:hypothetical protein